MWFRRRPDTALSQTAISGTSGASFPASSMLSDSPLVDSGLDRLGRGEFALRLARTLAERSSDHGYVVGLYGQWGKAKRLS